MRLISSFYHIQEDTSKSEESVRVPSEWGLENYSTCPQEKTRSSGQARENTKCPITSLSRSNAEMTDILLHQFNSCFGAYIGGLPWQVQMVAVANDEMISTQANAPHINQKKVVNCLQDCWEFPIGLTVGSVPWPLQTQLISRLFHPLCTDPRDSACWALPQELSPPTPSLSKQKACYSLPPLPVSKSHGYDGSDTAGKPLQGFATLDCTLAATSVWIHVTVLKRQEAENSTVPWLVSSLPPS